jgi:hypothetical protein
MGLRLTTIEEVRLPLGMSEVEAGADRVVGQFGLRSREGDFTAMRPPTSEEEEPQGAGIVSESATIRPESCWQLATGPDRMAVWPYRRDARSSEVEAFGGRLSPLPKSRAKPRDQRSTGQIDQPCATGLQRGGGTRYA